MQVMLTKILERHETPAPEAPPNHQQPPPSVTYTLLVTVASHPHDEPLFEGLRYKLHRMETSEEIEAALVQHHDEVQRRAEEATAKAKARA